MKKMILALALTLAASAQAEEVTMISRYNFGSYETTATYSFRKMTHDVGLTRNNWDILFEARGDFQDYFETNTVTDDRSTILDLGTQCDISAQALQGDQNQLGRANVVEGHCYLALVSDRDGSATVIFKVKKHVKSFAVVLSDINVLFKSVSGR